MVQCQPVEEAAERASARKEVELTERLDAVVNREADLELRDRELVLTESSQLVERARLEQHEEGLADRK